MAEHVVPPKEVPNLLFQPTLEVKDPMGLHQTFSFEYESVESVRSFLHELAASASVEERAPEFYLLSQKSNEPKFTFDCEVTPKGIRSERAGEYFAFLGVFVEALTGRFGAVTVQDA